MLRTFAPATRCCTQPTPLSIARFSTCALLPIGAPCTVASTFTDGAPSGTRRLTDGNQIDLNALVNMANCGRRSTCSAAALSAVTTDRPWGHNNPRWRLLAYGWLDALLEAGPQGSPYYVVALIGDDGSENDGDPTRDGFRIGPLPNPGADLVLLRGEAFGPRAAHYEIEAVVERYAVDSSVPTSAKDLRIRAWRAVH